MTESTLTPADLLDAARTLLARTDATTVGLWPRAAAHLTRQALEELLDALWRQRAAGTEAVSRKAQLICLRHYLHPAELAGQVAHTWAALSNACHQHPYELAPTAAELGDWITTVEQLAGE